MSWSGKPRRTPRPLVEARSVLVLREKHGSRYFVVDNDYELFAVALTVLRGRLKSECYYYDPGEPPAPLDFTKEDAEKMPPSLRESAISQLRAHAKKAHHHACDKADWDDINLACSSADGRAAWRILSDRAGGEYEHVVVEPASKTY